MARRSASSTGLPPERFAPAGLWVAGLGFLAFFLILVVKLLSYIGIYSIPNARPINLGMYAALGMGLIGLAAYALLDPDRVRDLLSGRQARHGSNALILLVAFSLILIVVNAIVYQNPVQWDLTESKTNSLAPETINAIKALPAPVHAIGFFTSNANKSDAQTLLNNIKSKSNGKFTFEFIDPNKYPAVAQQYKITQDATIVLSMNGHQELFTTTNEQDFTNALVKLMNPGQRTVYFLTGHGEGSIDNSSATSFLNAKRVLESKNYTVKDLNLLAQGKVPADALAVIIAGPSQPIQTQEANILKDYVSKGGALVVLEQPNLSQTAENPAKPDALEDYLSNSWSIKVDNDMIIDTTSPYASWAVANSYAAHPVTDSLTSQNLVTFFPDSSSLTLNPQNKDIQTTALVKTIENAWGETDFASLQSKQVTNDKGKDFAGPLTVAAAAENPSAKGKVVVFGDVQFANDTYFGQYGNSDLFINSVDWAAGQQNMISLTTKAPINRQMKPLTNLTVLVLAFAFVILIPGLVLAGGIASWIARRRRG